MITKKTYLIISIFLILVSWNKIYSALDSKALYRQGMEAFKSGNFGSAGLLFKKIIDSDDDDFKDEAMFYFARTFFSQKKYKTAIFEFNSYLNKCRTTSLCIQSRYWIGESNFYLKNYDNAIEEYKRYIINSKNNDLAASAHDRIGIVYYEQNRFDESIIEWEKALSLSKNKSRNADWVLKIGKALFENKQYDKSLKRLSPLLASNTNPKTVSMARLITGRIFQKKNRYKKSLLIFKGIPEILQKEYPFVEVLYYKALSHIKTNKINSAIPLLDLFILLGKKSGLHYDAQYLLGEIYISSDKKKKGIELLDMVYKHSKKNYLIKKSSKILSNIYLKDKPESAIPYLEESIKTDLLENDIDILLLLGKAYIKVGKHKKAEIILTKYKKNYPYSKDLEEVDFLLARIYLEEGKINKALNIFENIKKENPFSKFIGESNFYLALLYYKKDEPKKSITLLKKYLRVKKNNNRFQANLLLTNSYLKVKDFRNAKKTLDLVLKKYKNSKGLEKVVYNYAMSIDKMKQNANHYFALLINYYPKSIETAKLYLMLANRYFTSKNYENAEIYYNSYLLSKQKHDRGLAYYNRLLSNFNLRKFDKVISIIKKENIPALEEWQWDEIPLLLSRSYYELKKYKNVYRIMSNQPLENLSYDDILIFAKSAIIVEDLTSAKIAGKLLLNNKNLYAEYLYNFGDYYLKNNKNSDAMGYYSRILIECPGTNLVDSAKIKISEIYILDERYTDAINNLVNIKSKKIQNKKNSLLIISFYKLKNYKSAMELTKTNLNRLLKSEFGEPVLKINIEYYYNNENLRLFNRYIYYLSKYKGNKQYINYMSGKMNYKKKFFRKSYYNFYRLSSKNNEYYIESLFMLGKINMLKFRNRNNAVKYFKKLMIANDKKNIYYNSAKINLAILLYENNKSKESIAYLKDIIKTHKRGNFKVQAENLLEYFNSN